MERDELMARVQSSNQTALAAADKAMKSMDQLDYAAARDAADESHAARVRLAQFDAKEARRAAKARLNQAKSEFHARCQRALAEYPAGFAGPGDGSLLHDPLVRDVRALMDRARDELVALDMRAKGHV